ncbi:tetratricopeptide repeat protein [Candidatus Glomeribacter gigasporarum]|uniref:tetratricopeptide repeat protein n=1 Tax=Candidatus Glomeribacter gigasporarum TaxID=132144 RepID=UPI0002DDF400|nr:tetratricopeptide repeat protein [Candidatus Glomeribacter gigasporarum]
MKSFRDLIRIAFIACWTGYLGNASGDQDALHLKNDAQARFKHATALAQQGQDDEAIALFDALIAQYPELPEPYNNLAALHAKYGRLDAARAALESALAVHSDYALAYQNLGRVYLQLAERAYQRTLELEPRNASAKRMQQRIQSILAPSAKSR